jgi:hypothetical protein
VGPLPRRRLLVAAGGDAAQHQQQPIRGAGRKAGDQRPGVRVQLAAPAGRHLLDRDGAGVLGDGQVRLGEVADLGQVQQLRQVGVRRGRKQPDQVLVAPHDQPAAQQRPVHQGRGVPGGDGALGNVVGAAADQPHQHLHQLLALQVDRAKVRGSGRPTPPRRGGRRDVQVDLDDGGVGPAQQLGRAGGAHLPSGAKLGLAGA